MTAAVSVTPDRILTRLQAGGVNTLWATMRAHPDVDVPIADLSLIHALLALARALKKEGWRHEGNLVQVHYMVLASEHPKYFNLGGDLRHFLSCIQQKLPKVLHQYSRDCLDTVYEWATFSHADITTVGLVQGRALGGGFEVALSCDFLVAEEQSQFGFPEIKFGLFPCSGGMNFLTRRVGAHQAERMLTSPRLYEAAELKKMGLVDEVCPQGRGREAVQSLIATHARRRASRLAVQRSRDRIAPINYSEMLNIVEEWVAVAMQLSEEEARVMEMTVTVQLGALKATKPVTTQFGRL